MKESIVVYGPPMCGKTRNGEALRRALGMDSIFDEGTALPATKPPKHGALILAREPGAFEEFSSIAYADAIRRVPG